MKPGRVKVGDVVWRVMPSGKLRSGEILSIVALAWLQFDGAKDVYIDQVYPTRAAALAAALEKQTADEAALEKRREKLAKRRAVLEAEAAKGDGE